MITTEKITSITPDQEAQLNKFVADMIRKMKLSKDGAQELIKGFGGVKAEILPILQNIQLPTNVSAPPFANFKSRCRLITITLHRLTLLPKK